MARIVLVHGIRDDGRAGLDALGRRLRSAHDHPVLKCDYARITPLGRLGALWGRPGMRACETFVPALVERVTRWVRTNVRPGDHLVGHSYGCELIRRVAWEYQAAGLRLGWVWLFNAAVAADAPWPNGVTTCGIVNVYNRRDRALALARLARVFLGSSMGQLGRVGYRGPDNARLVDFDATEDDHASLLDHTTEFDAEDVRAWAELIDRGIVSGQVRR